MPHRLIRLVVTRYIAPRKLALLAFFVIAFLALLAPRASSPVYSGTAQPIWVDLAPLLDPNSEIAVAAVGDEIYVLGGYPSNRRYVDTVEVYRAATDIWHYGKPLPQPMHHTMAATVNGRLYVIGGEISSTGIADEGIYLDTVYEFDPDAGTWTGKASMPTPRSAGGTAVIDGKIYVAGGRPPHGHDFAVYDPAADSWTVLPNLPTQRNHLAVAPLRGKVYVAGGRFGGGVGSEMTDVVEAYDPASGSWSKAAPMITTRAGVNGIAARGCFYVWGGEGNDSHPLGVFPQLEVYDPNTDSWQSLESMPIPVHGVTGSAFVDGLIHAPGGGLMRGGNSGSTLHQAFRPPLSCDGG
jgi:N-acetylneuraminic acid mutarotase